MKTWAMAGILSVVALASACQSRAPKEHEREATLNWTADFQAAQAQATEKGLTILANFSGSDWCGWCIRLDEEVFAHQAFKDYADDNIVLFLADFPNKTKLPEDVAQQNERLAKQYGVRGFPTILLLNADGQVLGRTGYQRGGPEAYVEHLKKLLEEKL